MSSQSGAQRVRHTIEIDLPVGQTVCGIIITPNMEATEDFPATGVVVRPPDWELKSIAFVPKGEEVRH